MMAHGRLLGWLQNDAISGGERRRKFPHAIRIGNSKE